MREGCSLAVVFALLVVGTAPACSLLVSLDDLTGSADSGLVDVTDATNDVVDASDALVEASVVCDGGSTVIACAGSCVDIATSTSNCGACAHDCGGGMCVAGACQPVVVADSLSSPVFAVDDTTIYFAKPVSGGAELDSCPASGCKLVPTTLATPGLVYASGYGNVVLAGGTLAFFGELASNPGRPRLFACATTGCGATPQTIVNAGLQSIGPELTATGTDLYWTFYHYIEHAPCASPGSCSTFENMVTLTTGVWPRIGLSSDPSGLYYIDPFMHALVACPTSGTCTPGVLLSPVPATAVSTAVTGGNVYVLDSYQSGYSQGTIRVCPNAGTCTPSTFINNQPYPTLIAADGTGVYWFDSDAHDIKTCPLSGCVPSTRTLATSQSATELRTNTAFVYWATATQILRVAK